MGGGNHQSKPPPPSSSSINRQSRWQRDTTNTNNNNSSSSNPNNNNKHQHQNHPKPSPHNTNNNNKVKPPNNNSNLNLNPNLNPNPSTTPSRHPPFPLFPDHPPPPPPAYGFHMLERRTIILADGTVRSYLALPPDYHHTSTTTKRKVDDIEQLARHRDHLLRTANLHNTTNPDPDIMIMMRPNKQSRVGVSDADASSSYSVVDHAAKLKKAFLHYAKLINENLTLKNTLLADGKQGRLHCAACSRSAKEFPNMHALIMHTYNTDNADLRVDHLGLHKALCVLMGWNYSKPPDNSKAYQFLSADEAAANQDDLIMWPPLVIIHNTNTGKSRDGRMEGLGNKNMDSRIRELGFTGGKSKSLYGRDGHLGITLVKFAGDQSGLKEAVQLAEYLEKESHGRKDWIRLQSLTLGKDDENNPNLVKVDEEKGEKRRILYGYLGTVFDLDKVDFDTRKKVAIESKREYKPSM